MYSKVHKSSQVCNSPKFRIVFYFQANVTLKTHSMPSYFSIIVVVVVVDSSSKTFLILKNFSEALKPPRREVVCWRIIALMDIEKESLRCTWSTIRYIMYSLFCQHIHHTHPKADEPIHPEINRKKNPPREH